MTSFPTEIEIRERQHLEADLDRVVDEAIREALKRPGHGILVTRLNHGRFAIEVTPEVAQGTIQERDETLARSWI